MFTALFIEILVFPRHTYVSCLSTGSNAQGGCLRETYLQLETGWEVTLYDLK